MTIPTASGDVVLRRADGFIAYQLATVIDELSFGITDVVRGADLREALPAQRSLFAALGERTAPVPAWAAAARCPWAETLQTRGQFRPGTACVPQGWMRPR